MKNKTAFSDTAADPLSRLNMRKEGLFDLIVEKESDLKEGPYIGYIVEAKLLDNGQLKAYVRIPEIHDFIIPTACKSYSESQNKALKSMLVTALSSGDIYNDNQSPGVVDYRGREVEITFLDGAPKQQGKMRGAVMKLLSSTIKKDSQFCYLGAGEGQVVLNPSFNRKNTKLISLVKGGVSKGRIIKGGLNLTWQELKDIASSGLFAPLMKNIAQHESGQSYLAYNRGNCDDCGGIGQDPIIEAYGGKLTELSIATLSLKAMVLKKIGGKSIFATGKYQITPYTLRPAIRNIQGCDSREPYGPLQQEAFGIYLLLEKRPKVGKYLLGIGNIDIETAQLNLAQEWAAIRVLGHHTRPETRKYKTDDKTGAQVLTVLRKKAELEPGDSYYKNYNNWAKNGKEIEVGSPEAPRSDSNPDNSDKKRMRATKKALEDSRVRTMNSQLGKDLAKRLQGGK